MCMNNLSPNMYMQGVRPISFEELASKATYIENYMQHITRQSRPFNKPMEKSGEGDKVPTKQKPTQAMEATVSPPQFHPRSVITRNQENRDEPTPRRPTHSERQSREYSFPAEEVEDLFMGLWELNLIELPKAKRPEEASKFKEPKFCHYHHILGHTLKGCFMVKNIIQKMILASKVLCPLKKTWRHKDKRPKKCVSLAIRVFEDKDKSLHFPKEEGLEVDEVQLGLGHQLPNTSLNPSRQKAKV
jgi:hypothetical protein